MTDFGQIARDVDQGQKELYQAATEEMDAFAQFYRKSTADGVIGKKTKELIALAISVAIKCEGCIAIHARSAARHGASEEEIADALMVAVEMSGGPGVVYSAKALQAFRSFA